MSTTCRGCLSLESCGIPEWHLDEEIERCPCRICLVKMTCYTSICKDYSDFIRSIRVNR